MSFKFVTATDEISYFIRPSRIRHFQVDEARVSFVETRSLNFLAVGTDDCCNNTRQYVELGFLVVQFVRSVAVLVRALLDTD
jgi:hypothetical protein